MEEIQYCKIWIYSCGGQLLWPRRAFDLRDLTWWPEPRGQWPGLPHRAGRGIGEDLKHELLFKPMQLANGVGVCLPKAQPYLWPVPVPVPLFEVFSHVVVGAVLLLCYRAVIMRTRLGLALLCSHSSLVTLWVCWIHSICIFMYLCRMHTFCDQCVSKFLKQKNPTIYIVVSLYLTWTTT